MATRQEAIDANTQHFAEFQERFPEVDAKPFAASQERTIHFRFDVDVLLLFFHIQH